MCDLICAVITFCAWSCDTGKISASDKIMFEIQKKIENVKTKDILHKAPSKRLFWNGIHSFLKRADARGSDDIIYHIWRMSLLCGSGMVILSSESRLRVEYLIPTNNIIALDSYFNLTNKSNLIGGLYTIFWSFGSGLVLLGPPCIW